MDKIVFSGVSFANIQKDQKMQSIPRNNNKKTRIINFVKKNTKKTNNIKTAKENALNRFKDIFRIKNMVKTDKQITNKCPTCSKMIRNSKNFI